ncbi:unnamed protein product [Effrenium voratum]|nr:unnamed protein product [Effrenium voratum]
MYRGKMPVLDFGAEDALRPAISVEEQLPAKEDEEGDSPKMGQARFVAPPSRPERLPDASKFVKFFEESQGLKAPGPGPSGPRRGGRRWTVVVNQASNMAMTAPPPPKSMSFRSGSMTDRERPRTSGVHLESLPPAQKAKARSMQDVYDTDLEGLLAESVKPQEPQEDWKGWYKVQKVKKAQVEPESESEEEVTPEIDQEAAEREAAAKEAAAKTRAEVEAAKELWQKIRSQANAEDDAAREQFAQSLPPGVAKFAALLVNRFGSLERAFNNFDYNRKGKVTRGQFQTTLATIRLNTEEVVGLPSKKVFRLIAAGAQSALEITLEQWQNFFDQELSGEDASFLLTEDRGSQAPKRWAQMKQLPSKALQLLVEQGELADKDELAKEALSKHGQRKVGQVAATARRSDGEKHPDGERRLKIQRSSDSDDREDTADPGGSSDDARDYEADDADDDANSLRAGTELEDGSASGTGSVGGSLSASWAATLESARAALNESSSEDDSEASEVEMEDKKRGPRDLKHSGVDSRHVDREKVMRAFRQRDDKAVAELNDDELQALAEQVQLQQEIEDLDLTSIDAFAYVLLAKLGSFKRAFKWFDFNCTRKITNVTWDTGILLLHVDTEHLTGLKPGQIFYRMDTVFPDVAPSGMITRRKKWTAFFSGFKPPPELLKLMEEGKTLRQRANAKKKQYKRRGSLWRGDKGQRVRLKKRDDVDLSEDEMEEEARAQRLAEEEDGFRKWAEAELASIEDGTFKEYHDAIFRGGAESLMSPFQRRQIFMDFTEAMGLYTLAPQGHGRAPPRNATSLERVEGMDGSDALPPPGCIKVYKLKSFTEEIAGKLESISSGGRLPLSQPFSDIESAVVNMLAMDRNLVVVSEKWGHGRRLVIHDTGSFAKGLNSKLDALEEGGSLSLASNMSNIEMKLVQATAAKMGLVVSTSKDEKGEEIVKVFKMSDYKAEVRDKLINVDVGKRCFLQNLAEEECAVVHQVASELGLRSMESAGDSEGTRNIVIFSSTEYVAEQAVRMGHVADGGQAEFFVPQTSAQRQAFWDLADKNGMCLDTSYHGTKGQEDFRSGDVVRLTKCLGDSSSATDEENPGDLQGLSST